MNNVAQLGAAVTQLRRDAGWTQEQLADKAGVSRRWLVMFENGRTPGVDATKVFRTLEKLGMELAVLPRRPPSVEEQELLDLLGD